MLQRLSLGMLLLCAFSAAAACEWPGWQQYKQYYISPQGRVIDPSSPNKITTSEGQSYGLFFARWPTTGRPSIGCWLGRRTTRRRAISAPVCPRLWGESDDKQWKVLDANSASDADLWIAYNLLEAGRLWKSRRYQTRDAAAATHRPRGSGRHSRPGPDAVAGQSRVRGGRSLAAEPQLPAAAAAGAFCGAERPVARDAPVNQRLWLDTAPHGFSPDWVVWRVGAGWQPDTVKPNVGSYDAIRVYLWAGMLADDDEHKAALLERFQPMAQLTAKQGVPPEKPIPPAAKPPAPARSAFPPRCCRCWRRRPRH